jgi:hypothetical protein
MIIDPKQALGVHFHELLDREWSNGDSGNPHKARNYGASNNTASRKNLELGSLGKAE